MAPRRTKGQAQARLDLSDIAGDMRAQDMGGISDLIEKFNPYLDGIVETLGMAAQPTLTESGVVKPGDPDAAKKALDFLGKVLTDRQDSRQRETLGQIAEIRRTKFERERQLAATG